MVPLHSGIMSRKIPKYLRNSMKPAKVKKRIKTKTTNINTWTKILLKPRHHQDGGHPRYQHHQKSLSPNSRCQHHLDKSPLQNFVYRDMSTTITKINPHRVRDIIIKTKCSPKITCTEISSKFTKSTIPSPGPKSRYQHQRNLYKIAIATFFNLKIQRKCDLKTAII